MNQTNQRSDISCANSSTITRPAGHYSHVCVAAGQVFISGQLPIQPDGTALTGRSFEEQAAQVLANLEACLACAGVVNNRGHDIDAAERQLGSLPAAQQRHHRPPTATHNVTDIIRTATAC